MFTYTCIPWFKVELLNLLRYYMATLKIVDNYLKVWIWSLFEEGDWTRTVGTFLCADHWGVLVEKNENKEYDYYKGNTDEYK